MPFLWLAIEDEAGPQSLRGYIERNAIALFSNYNKPPLDPPSAGWLGRCGDRERVRNSGLWNSNHVDEIYEPAFLDKFDELVSAMVCSHDHCHSMRRKEVPGCWAFENSERQAG